MIISSLLTLLSHWYRNPLQIFAFLSGVALATALWSGVQAINHEAKISYRAAAQTLGEGRYDLIRPKQGKTISVLDYVNLRKSGWLVSPVVDGYIDKVRLLGMDPLTLPSSFLFANTNLNSSISGNDFFELLMTNENSTKNNSKKISKSLYLKR